ncbi:hypothetical protein DFQ26_006040 [Actinomortierella ambigua]|nr:hypothetical protein DFQ26_006040 [Actinomortierella ambigua]
MPQFPGLQLSAKLFKRHQSPPSGKEVSTEAGTLIPDNPKEFDTNVSRAVVIDHGSMELVDENTHHRSNKRREPPSASRQERSNQDRQRGSMEVPQKCEPALDRNQELKIRVVKLQNSLHHLSVDHQNLQSAYDELLKFHGDLKNHHARLEHYFTGFQQFHAGLSQRHANLEVRHSELAQRHGELQQSTKEQEQKAQKMAKRYEDLDRKYMDIARTLQVTAEDRFTISRMLETVCSTIENLVIACKGKGSVNLNTAATIAFFQPSGWLQQLPVQESQLQPFHLNLCIESAMMEILIDRLFERPLECIFDQSEQFEKICGWVEGRGSRASARWRQELCILIAQDGNEMACRKEKAVMEAAMELKELVTNVYRNVDTSSLNKIKELSSLAFDISYAMYGMESRVSPFHVDPGTPFNDNDMTMATQSNPNGNVSLVVFRGFRDSDNKLYSKLKVWSI